MASKMPVHDEVTKHGMIKTEKSKFGLTPEGHEAIDQRWRTDNIPQTQ
jgi:hypothetical protein